MSAVDNTPINKNFLSPLNFTFVLKRSPNLNFFVQSINIPSLSLGSFMGPSPLLNIPYSGDHIEYSNLQVQFKIDENFQNYMEIFNWIKGLGYPENQTEYQYLSKQPKTTGAGLKSEISLIISDAIKNPNYEIVFTDCFPIDLSEINFQTTDDSVNYVSAVVTFKYTYFNIMKL
jgi:hypothetical protein